MRKLISKHMFRPVLSLVCR